MISHNYTEAHSPNHWIGNTFQCSQPEYYSKINLAPLRPPAAHGRPHVHSLVEICKPDRYNATRALAAVSDPWYGVRCRSEGKRQAQALPCLLLLPNLPPGPGKRAATRRGDPQKQKRASPKARPLNPSNSKGRTNLNSERMNLNGS